MKGILRTAEEMRNHAKIVKSKKLDDILDDIFESVKEEYSRCEIETDTDMEILKKLRDLGYRIYEETYNEERRINLLQRMRIIEPYIIEHTKLYVDWSEEGDDNMFRLIDYKEHEFSDGFSGQIDYYYKVENVNTGEVKWVSKYEYENMKRQGFIK